MAALTPSCHEQTDTRTAPEGARIVAFIGAPNVGKSTLFNALTGQKRMMGNWPGTSVEVGRGTWSLTDQSLDAIDFPGAYSLDPQSPDEELTRQLLLEVPAGERPDAVVVVADATSLARSLYLVAQVREHPYRVIVALTMNDVAARRGLSIDPAVLSERLGCPVVPVDPRKRTGIAELTRAIADSLAEPVPAPRELPADLAPLADAGEALEADACAGCEQGPDAGAPDAAEAQELDEFALADDRFAWIDEAVRAGASAPERTGPTATERVDRFLLHPLIGPLVFMGVMWCVFQLTTTIAVPLQDGLDSLFTGPVTSGAAWLLGAIGLDQPLVTGLILNGLIAGVGTVLTFAPLMAIMFLLLALLEDSGYMARAAVVADRLMRTIGLPGKAFLPLIVGFGCNVPAISATRVLGNARQRLMTALLIPFTSCSARLTVYVMLAQTFFPRHAGTVVFAMYVVSILLIVLCGLVMKTTVWRTLGSSALVMDLPTYQIPSPRLILQVTWMRLRGFLQTAGGIIVTVVIAVWLLQALPATGGHPIGDVPPEDSWYAALSGFLAPLFAPAGFADWRIVGALVTGFLAKEAVISSWAQTYSVVDPSDASPTMQGTSALAQHLHQSFDVASGGHASLAVVAFMVFLLAYTPCVATLAAQKREIGLKWTVFGVVMQLAVAYVLAVATFQIGLLLS